jgi:hypothetical protein
VVCVAAAIGRAVIERRMGEQGLEDFDATLAAAIAHELPLAMGALEEIIQETTN